MGEKDVMISSHQCNVELDYEISKNLSIEPRSYICPLQTITRVSSTISLRDR